MVLSATPATAITSYSSGGTGSGIAATAGGSTSATTGCLLLGFNEAITEKKGKGI